MRVLYHSKHLCIEKNDIQDCLDVIYYDICYEINILEKLLYEISKQVKREKATKIIFLANNLQTLGNDNFLMRRFIPCLGTSGIKNFAIVTGNNEQSKVYFQELSNCLAPLQKQYDITSKNFPDLHQAIEWISDQ